MVPTNVDPDHFCEPPESVPISEIADNVASGKWAVADFQRDLVWKWPNMEKFLESLYLGVPIGIVYTWGYKSSRHYRPFKNLEKMIVSKNDIEKLVLDGQQRITFLSWLFISSKQKDLYDEVAFNVKETDDIPVLRKTTKNNPVDYESGEVSLQLLISEKGVSRCNNKLNSFPWYDGNIHLARLNHMRESICDTKIGIQNVKKDTTRQYALFIFDRVNREGKQLNEVDLVESILTTHWSDLFNEIRDLVEGIQTFNKGLKPKTNQPDLANTYKAVFNRPCIIRSVMYQLHGTTKRDDKKLDIFNPLNSKGKPLTEKNVKDAFTKVRKAIVDLKSYIQSDLKFNSLASFSYLTAVVAIQYLIKYPTPSDIRKNKMLAWFCVANKNPIYTGGSTYDLADEDCGKATSKPDCWENLIETIQRERERKIDGNKIHNLLLTESDFGTLGEQPVSSGIVVQLGNTQLKNARDWLSGHNLGSMSFRELESHHIFPKSKFISTIVADSLKGKKPEEYSKNVLSDILTKAGINHKKDSSRKKLVALVRSHEKAWWQKLGLPESENFRHNMENHLCNKAWIKKYTNNKISDSLPIDYLPNMDDDRLIPQGIPSGSHGKY